MTEGFVVFAKNNCALQNAGHFGQIPRPVVVHEHAHGLLVHLIDGLGVLQAVAFEIVLHQPWNIAAMLPERRYPKMLLSNQGIE